MGHSSYANLFVLCFSTINHQITSGKYCLSIDLQQNSYYGQGSGSKETSWKTEKKINVANINLKLNLGSQIKVYDR